MPTFTALALDRLIEPGASKTTGKNGSESKIERRNSSTNSNPERGTSCPPPRPERTSSMTSAKKNHWAWISPALYATPESTPLPDSPSSFPPSPYIINHKRRGPRLLKSSSHNSVDSDRRDMDEEKVGENESNKNGEREVVDLDKGNDLEETGVNGVHDGEFGSGERTNESAGSGQSRSLKAVTFEAERDSEAEDFYDFQDSMSVKSSNEGESMAALERSLTAVTPMAEFYDAWEELSSESGPQLLHDIEIELREMQLSLLTEMEKRKQAEAALNSMRNQWTQIGQQLSTVGLTLPPDPTAVDDPADKLCQQVGIARLVSNAIGRGIAKAEIEEEMEAQIESMNFEIARLMDRLHFYEAVNREMSQRNQEVVETARRLRQSRKRRQKWVWGSIATAITLGTFALAWSYLPNGKSSPSVSQSRTPETDHSSSK